MVARKGRTAEIEWMKLRTAEGTWNNLALMMSDQNPWAIEIRRDNILWKRLEGGVPTQLIDAEAGIMELRKELTDTTNINLGKIPSRAIRELLLNAVSHRSYCDRGPIVVDLNGTMTTVTNPGGHMRLGPEHSMRTRNPNLTKTLRNMGFADPEMNGMSGVMRSYRSC